MRPNRSSSGGTLDHPRDPVAVSLTGASSAASPWHRWSPARIRAFTVPGVISSSRLRRGRPTRARGGVRPRACLPRRRPRGGRITRKSARRSDVTPARTAAVELSPGGRISDVVDRNPHRIRRARRHAVRLSAPGTAAVPVVATSRPKWPSVVTDVSAWSSCAAAAREDRPSWSMRVATVWQETWQSPGRRPSRDQSAGVDRSAAGAPAPPSPAPPRPRIGVRTQTTITATVPSSRSSRVLPFRMTPRRRHSR